MTLDELIQRENEAYEALMAADSETADARFDEWFNAAGELSEAILNEANRL